MSHLGKYLKTERERHDLTRGQLAKMAGFSNISKWARRIYEREQEGKENPILLERLVNFLTIHHDIVEELAEKDRQESLASFEKWVNEPVSMELIVRFIPGVYGNVSIPDQIRTPEEAESWACRTAKEYKKKVCLQLSRKESVWINEQGQITGRSQAKPDLVSAPYMKLKGSKIKFPLDLG